MIPPPGGIGGGQERREDSSGGMLQACWRQQQPRAPGGRGREEKGGPGSKGRPAGLEFARGRGKTPVRGPQSRRSVGGCRAFRSLGGKEAPVGAEGVPTLLGPRRRGLGERELGAVGRQLRVMGGGRAPRAEHLLHGC